MSDAQTAPSRLPRLTLTFGLLLAAMGYAIYFATGRTTFGAMSPTFLGIPIVLCAVIANTPQLRRAAWVGAVGCALIGVGIAAYKLHSVGAFDVSRRPVEIGLTVDAKDLPPALASLEPVERSIALQRAERQWRAALLSWPVFALFCLGYVALSWSESGRSKKVPIEGAT
ncbi:MAG: hypothetical protein IT459_06655 [Planctomycetes bacterium]|nr:hypothetical protein [Planctomycetota bacterium]